MIEYEFEGFVLEFTPESAYTKGYLAVTAGESVFGAKIDIASSKARSTFVKDARDLYPDAFEDELGLRRALNELSVHLTDQERNAQAKAEEKVDEDGAGVDENRPEEGSERYAAAMEILHSEDVLEGVAEAMQTLGHVGEWANKKLAFACAVSARAQLPVQPSTHAQSSAGKNYLWDTALALVPPELVYKRTGFSAKALFRTKMSLKHSVLYIQELAGSEGADFSIRTLQSDNVLRWEATEKQPDGTMANVEYEVEGPCVIVQTTTKNHLHPENETRVVPIYLDETAEQTERITREVLRRAAGKGDVSQNERDVLFAAWHDAVRLLEPAEVIVPFAERIKVPSTPLRLRRDVPRLLNIIRLVAWVHQHTRDRDEAGRIIATEDDFEKAIHMVGDSFARAWKSLTPSEEKIYAAITEHVSANLQKHGFKRSHVEDALEKTKVEISSTVVKDSLRTLASSGFLESDGKRGAAGATYTIAKSANAIGSITLAFHPSINEKADETRVDKPDSMYGGDSVHSRPFGYSPDNENKWTNGRKRPGDARPLKSADLWAIPANGRIDGEAEPEGEPERDFEYSEDD
jgi:hypothetical protein